MAKPKSKASSTTHNSSCATGQAAPNGLSDYFTRKQYTQQQLDLEKSRSRQQAENEQTQLEADARVIKQLEIEIEDLESRLHDTKMRHKDNSIAYNKSMTSLVRQLDSIR